MSVFIGEKNKRVELAERKDAINPNLLLNSRDFSANWSLSTAAIATVTSDSYNEGIVLSLHKGGNGATGLAISQGIQTPPSQTVTWSVYAKADNAGDKLHTELDGGGGMTDQAVTTDWCRYTFKGTFSTSKYILYFWGISSNKGDIYIALPKLEIGNIATPWCPALEDYAWASDITNLQNTVNSKVNVDGPLYKDLKQFNNWSDLFDDYAHSELTAAIGRLVTFRDDTNGANTVGDFGSGIAFGGGDTSGALSVDPFDHQARITSGNGNHTSPAWHEDIAWKSDITSLQNVVNGKANSTDITNLQSMITGLQGQITEIQSKNYIEGYNCANESDAETYSKAHPTTLVTVS